MEVEINGARNIVAFDNVPLFGTVTITQTLIVSWLILIIIPPCASGWDPD